MGKPVFINKSPVNHARTYFFKNAETTHLELMKNNILIIIFIIIATHIHVPIYMISEILSLH